jgi:hypothetical protein
MMEPCVMGIAQASDPVLDLSTKAGCVVKKWEANYDVLVL